MIGFGEIALIVLVVLIIFGAGKLPQVMGDLGRGMRSFKDGLREGEKNADTGSASHKSVAEEAGKPDGDK